MNSQHQLRHLAPYILHHQAHRARSVDHDHHVESGAPQAADEAAEPVADTLTVTRAYTPAAADSNSAVSRAHVVVRGGYRLARVVVDLRGSLDRQHLELGQLRLGQIGVL